MKTKFTLCISILILMVYANQYEEKDSVQEKQPLIQEEKTSLGRETSASKNVVFESTHDFNEYKVEVFKGKLAKPNFEGNPFAEDETYVKLFAKGCQQNGINFGGKYTIITRSCGLMCEHLYIIDRKTGEIFTDIYPNEGRWGYAFQPNSTMMIANSSLFQGKAFQAYEDNGHQQPELYIWKENNFEKIQ